MILHPVLDSTQNSIYYVPQRIPKNGIALQAMYWASSRLKGESTVVA